MSCIVQKTHTLSKCDVIQSVCDVVNRVRMMTKISVCDVTGIVYRWPYILDVVSHIETVMS